MKNDRPALRITQLLLLSVGFLLFNIWPVLAQQPERQLRTVTRVIDGDTIVLDTGEKVRLIGVDTPETHHPQKPVEYFGKEASAFTRSLVEGQRVLVETDPANSHLGHKDKYGRTLAYVWNERGKFVNAEIIEQGYGHALTRYPFKYLNEFRGLEQRAMRQGTGLWMSGAGVSRGSDYRQSINDTTDRTVYAPRTHQLRSASHPSSGFETSRAGTSGERSSSASPYVNGPVVGHTATGIPMYEGSRGGRYHITSGGHKSYHSRSASSQSSGGGRRR